VNHPHIGYIYIHLFIHSFFHSFTHPSIHTFMHTFSHSTPLNSTPLNSTPLTHSFTHSLIHSFLHSFIPSIPFHSISFHFISLHFISFHFTSFHFISLHFISFIHSLFGLFARLHFTFEHHKAGDVPRRKHDAPTLESPRRQCCPLLREESGSVLMPGGSLKGGEMAGYGPTNRTG
jgi:hypothetical protein